MAASTSSSVRAVADIGGTNTRLALYDPVSAEFRARCDYRNSEYQQLEDILEHWLESLQEPAPRDCCLAIAAPPIGDTVRMLNINWSFSRREMAARFGFAQLRFINDFQGNAFSLPHLTRNDYTTLRPGISPVNDKLVALGPGTGLGGATLEYLAGEHCARACEPGHMGLAPATELELEIFRTLLPHHGEVYAELLVSGPGLQRLYLTLAEIEGRAVTALAPTEITANALSGDDALCRTALDTFCSLLGSVAGDFVLANGAYGGVFLTGGIVPDVIPVLREGTFEQRFTTKGGMREHLARVPIHVVTSGMAGLIGAAHAPL